MSKPLSTELEIALAELDSLAYALYIESLTLRAKADEKLKRSEDIEQTVGSLRYQAGLED